MANVLVIGGGAAGLLAGIAAAQSGAQTVILEKCAARQKILITGKGRCNITNNCDLQEIIKNIPGNGRFLNSALRRFNQSGYCTASGR